MNRRKRFLATTLVFLAVVGLVVGISLFLQPGEDSLGIMIILAAALLGVAGVISGLNDAYDLIGKLSAVSTHAASIGDHEPPIHVTTYWEETQETKVILRLPPLNFGDLYLHRFRIKAPLGRGGFSDVYLAHDHNEERDVALKLYRIAGQEDSIKAHIHRDGALSQQLVRDPVPGLVTNYEVGRLPEGYGLYICQEYIPDSTTLHDLLETQHSLEPRLVVQLVLEICTTLEHLHSRGLIHCDIKPLNILVTPQHRPVLLDLGAARQTGETDPPNAVATFPYSSQELMDGEVVDQRTDIYSLGMTLLHMLIGLPEWIESYGEVKSYVSEPIPKNYLLKNPPLGDVRAYSVAALLDIPSRDLREIVSKAIEADRRSRYQSATAFRLALQNYLDSH